MITTLEVKPFYAAIGQEDKRSTKYMSGTTCLVTIDIKKDINGNEYQVIGGIDYIADYLEVPFLNYFMEHREELSIDGVLRIQGQVWKNNELRPCTLSPGAFSIVLLKVQMHYKALGKLLLGKAKSQTDLFYIWNRPDKCSGLLRELLDSGKLYKELQRLLGGDIVRIVSKNNDPDFRLNCVCVDVDAYAKTKGFDIKDFGDGMIVTKHFLNLEVGGAIEQTTCNVRIINHPQIRISKGNLVTNESYFNRLCKYANVDPEAVDIVLPISAVKVGNVVANGIYDITEYIRLVGYKTKNVQSRGAITAIGTVTLGPVAKSVCHMLNTMTSIEKISSLMNNTMTGDLKSYMELVRTGSGENTAAEVMSIILPLWKDGKWTIIRGQEQVTQLDSRVVSVMTKKLRKIKIRGAISRRAAHSDKVEHANKDNFTGAYIISIRKNVVEIPQDVWVGLTLGDYDGDDAVLVPINKTKGIWLVFRNPINGPSSMFIGIEHGKGSVQDVPEEYQVLVRYHKQVKAVPEPAKQKVERATDIRSCVDEYVNTLFNASLNGPLLGMGTNVLYKQRINELINGIVHKAQQYAFDSATIEFDIVKAIKSTLETVITYQKLEDLFKIKFADKVDSKQLYSLNQMAQFLDQYNTDKLATIFEPQKFEDGTKEAFAWDCCSKFDYSLSFRDYYAKILKSGLKLGGYAESVPFVAGYKHLEFNKDVAISVNNTDVASSQQFSAYTLCNSILSHREEYSLPAVKRSDVMMINSLYSMITSRKNPTSTNAAFNAAMQYMYDRRNLSRKDNLSGEALRQHKLNTGLSIVRMMMGFNGKYSDPVDCCTKIVMLIGQGHKYVFGVNDIYDSGLRTYAYACLHALVRYIIVKKFSDNAARYVAALETGVKVFRKNADGSVISNRLFWLYISTFSGDMLSEFSSIWTDHQEKYFCANGDDKIAEDSKQNIIKVYENNHEDVVVDIYDYYELGDIDVDIDVSDCDEEIDYSYCDDEYSL